MQSRGLQPLGPHWIGIRPPNDTADDAASNLSLESRVARVGLIKDRNPVSKRRRTQLPQLKPKVCRNRRKVALTDPTSFCSTCGAIDFSSIFGAGNISQLDDNAGYLICIWYTDLWAAYCPLCRFFKSVSVDPECRRPLFGHHKTPDIFGLFAFSGKDTINLHRPTPWTDPVWLAVLPVPVGWAGLGKREIGYRSWERRGLPLIMQSTRVHRNPTGRSLSQQVDFDIVRHWLDYCTSHHEKTCADGGRLSIHGFRVIDCVTRDIKSGNSIDGDIYVALSYVWGSDSQLSASSTMAVTVAANDRLPEVVPRVVEDAMEVTRLLGIQFLWVDRYCIRQDRLLEKQEQIKRMGDIYKHAALTIVAAAGNCSSYGLPGVRDNPRSALPPQITVGYHVLATASTEIGHQLGKSTWNTRGWTYQEALLSRRRLVFTDTQVYFQCQSMSCLESFSIPLDDLHDDQHGRFHDDLTIPRVLPDLTPGDSEIGLKLSFMISQFSLRRFSVAADALDAFRGILKAMETAGWIRGNLYGIPLFSSDTDHASILTKSLLWNLSLHNGISSHWKVSRRREFPSWTWVGWKLHAESQSINVASQRMGTEIKPMSLAGWFNFEPKNLVSWETGKDEILSQSESTCLPTHLLLYGWVFDFTISLDFFTDNPEQEQEGLVVWKKSWNWTYGCYKFSISNPGAIIKISQHLGIVTKSYQYTFLCLEFDDSRQISNSRDRRLFINGLVLTQNQDKSFERLFMDTVNIRYSSDLGFFQQECPDPAMGWRREYIRLA